MLKGQTEQGNTAMSEIEDDVDAALSELGVLEACKVPKAKAAEIISEVRERFVEGNPRVWWLSLKTPVKRTVCKKDCRHYLPEKLPACTDPLYFIPETESLEPMPVYKLTHALFLQLIPHCPYFEYNIVSTDLQSLLIETEHAQLIEAGATFK